ncbi:MAG: hypothetical protein HYV67_03015 [Candidatus Taylorbacteria bacterium]|nr:hypothetical protein [Candidatus Taylorbacteria bacterium]
MIVKKIKNSFEDERGVIRDITTHTLVDAITYITFKKGAVRGNHYHNKSVQYDYILSGSFLCRVRPDATAPTEEKIVVAGDLVTQPFPQRHAYKALEDAVMLSCTLGPRQGAEFESDVVRLTGKDKLID